MSGPYKITGESPRPGVGTVSFTRETAKDAVNKAMEMMGEAVQDVHILDAENKFYGPLEFAGLVASET